MLVIIQYEQVDRLSALLRIINHELGHLLVKHNML